MNRFHYANTNDGNMLYLVRKQITDPFFFLEVDGEQHIFLSSVDIDAYKDGAYSGVVANNVDPFLKKSRENGSDTIVSLAITILENFNVSGDILVPKNFPLLISDGLRKYGFKITVSKDWIPERKIKSPNEIEYIRENFDNTKKAYVVLEEILSESKISGDKILYKDNILTCEFLKREISKYLFDFDLENKAGIIISCGRHTSMPHNQGTGPVLPNESIIADIFPQSSKNYYYSDMTRTYVKGSPSDDLFRIHETVSKAQKESFKVLMPGKKCKEIYDVSAKTILDSGFDVGEKGYIHSLGHGLGVDIHESPSLSSRSEEILEVGNVITIEPGLYYKEIGGVRIEDTVVITKDGYENLTNFETSWIIE